MVSFDDFDNKMLLDVALSADGSRVAARLRVFSRSVPVRESNEIDIRDVTTGKRLRPIAFEASPVNNGRLLFTADDKVIAFRNEAGKVTGWSVASGEPAKVEGNPFARCEREQHTSDGRRLWQLNGSFFMQSVPDERERERLRAQAEPDPARHADAAARAEWTNRWFAAAFHLSSLLLAPSADADLFCRRARAYIALDRFTDARADCDQAIRLRSRSAEALVTTRRARIP